MVDRSRVMEDADAARSKGYLSALGAFGIWGLFPLYMKLLHSVPSVQIIAHRVVWSLLFMLGWLGIRGELPKLRATLMDPRSMKLLAGTSVLISINWLVYVWSVLNNHVVETSLGYFINPLVNVVLGVVILSERLSRTQWTAVTLATIGVVYLTIVGGQLPWIALSLALSFGFYGFLRKVAAVDALPGLATETVLLAPFAAAFLLWCELRGTGAIGHASGMIDALLIFSGPLTAIALALFANGARRIPYSTLGVLQYIAPSLQFLCGVFVFHEPFERDRVAGFAFIWIAVVIYAAEGLWSSRQQMRAEQA